MRTIASSAAILSTLFLLAGVGPASAQATRTWVSGVGDDANPCSRTAPCKTFAGAISKTAINGEINCLDPGGFGGIIITKSITIDCHEIFASILASGVNGVIINVGVNANDPLRTVRLRNININGTGPSGAVGTRTGQNGIRILAASAVFLDDMLITEFTSAGVRDERTNTGTLFIRNSIIRDNTGPGIVIVPPGGAIVAAAIDNSHSNLSSHGIAVAAGNKVNITKSVFTGNTTAGIRADSGAEVNIDQSMISSNITGVDAGAGATVRLSNNNIYSNVTGVSGATTSFGNNRIAPNVGTAPSIVGQQ